MNRKATTLQRDRVTNPNTLPVGLNDLKLHLALERDETHWDDLLCEYGHAARELIEETTNLTLFTSTWKFTWSDFPAEVIEIPAYPIQSVTSLTYVDTDGEEQTIEDFQSNLKAVPAYIRPKRDDDWPGVRSDTVDTVTLEVVAGYGAQTSDLPATIRQMTRLLVGHWFANREQVLVGTISKEIEKGFNDLAARVRVNEFLNFDLQYKESP